MAVGPGSTRLVVVGPGRCGVQRKTIGGRLRGLRLGLVLLCRLGEWLELILRLLRLLGGELDVGGAAESHLAGLERHDS